MNILILGKGGREHALAWKLSQSELLSNLYIAPGNAGTESLGTNVDLDPMDFYAIREFCIEKVIDFIVVGPEEILAEGIADELEDLHTFVVGPPRKAAQLEASKYYGKLFMERHKIPTPGYKVFRKEDQLKKFLETAEYPLVLKVNGLATGKGSNIAYSYEGALQILNVYKNNPAIKDAADRIIVEEFIEGKELSIFLLISESEELLLGTVQDYKQLYENNIGPSTGGMGSISPVPFMNKELQKQLYKQIITPTIKGIRKDFPEYRGFLYIGAIYSKGNFYVLEYNVRLGDPETQCLFPVMDVDLVDLLTALREDNLKNKLIIPGREVAVTLTLAHKSYPYNKPEKPLEVIIPKSLKGVMIFHGNTKKEGYKYLTTGGRVLYITALADDYQIANELAVDAANKIQFEGKYFRKDIGLI